MSSEIKLKWNGDHKQWITDYQDLLDNKRIGDVTDKDNKPAEPSGPWPIATTAASFIERVALYDDVMLEASGIIASGAKANNTRRQVKAEQITADVLAQYARANTRNEKAAATTAAATAASTAAFLIDGSLLIVNTFGQ
jgi:hypothetical protein